MKTISHEAFLALRGNAKILEADGHGEKVLALEDGTILKLFRRKRFFSSALLFPYARRFGDNAVALRRIGICSPWILDIARVREIKRDVVHYVPVPGSTLRQLFRVDPYPPDLQAKRQAIAAFIAQLHDAGVYFRSLHLGNIVQTPDNGFGLIDISDLRIYPFALPGFLRQRNLARLERIAEAGEMAWIDCERILSL